MSAGIGLFIAFIGLRNAGIIKPDAATTVTLGSGVSTWHATLAQQGETLAQATAILGRPRVADRTWSPAAPVHERPWTAEEVMPPHPLRPTLPAGCAI